MTRSGCLKVRSMILRRVQAYPSDRSKEMATDPRGASPPRVTSARSQGKWIIIYVKLDIQVLIINLQVCFDGRHQKLTGLSDIRNEGFKKEGLLGNWMKILKYIMYLADRT